jgi:superfamily I DNA and RNA helicase
MSGCCEITIGPPAVFTKETFTVDINNRVTSVWNATGQEIGFVFTLDEPSEAELLAAARNIFAALDKEENDAASR